MADKDCQPKRDERDECLPIRENSEKDVARKVLSASIERRRRGRRDLRDMIKPRRRR